ncbi:hypothetical protein BTUL_0018g00060 [Botrytis tulipae]|uniref:Uncharacterized protein n=1 Tax=Botrytis tulipae TaxID=87230 RepID=A0A4Z1F187_9HELO|nr:hypothetical protein BTUL_0018g00060 [Botrytis tulipae]
MPYRTRQPQLSVMGSMAKLEGIKMSLLQKKLPKVYKRFALEYDLHVCLMIKESCFQGGKASLEPPRKIAGLRQRLSLPTF